MKRPDLPRRWREYLDAIDGCLAEKGIAQPVRVGIVQDVEDHLHQMAALDPGMAREHLPDLLDPPEAYAEAFEEATSAVPEAKDGQQPVRLRECHSRHGEDGKRRIHICGNCLRVFHGCFEYETHVCEEDSHWDGNHHPYWSHHKRWTSAIILAALLFAPVLWITHGYLTARPYEGRRYRYANYRYLHELMASIATFQVREKREPESLRELAESGIWDDNWIMPGDLEDLGGEGGFAAERLYYLHATGMNMSLSATRQPWLVLSYRSHNSRAIHYAVAYTDGEIGEYSTFDEFLADWEAKQ